MKYLIWVVFALSLSARLYSQQTAPVNTDSVYFFCPPCNLDCDTVHFRNPGICPVCGMTLFASYSGCENIAGDHHDYCSKKVAVLIFPGVEIIDFSGPWEVFGAAGMEVYAVSASNDIVTTSMGLKLKPDFTLSDAPAPDILLIPGGSVNIADTAVINWIYKTSKASEHTLSVCTGAFYLAAGGLLDSLEATTNFHAVGTLRSMAPSATVYDNVRYVDNGRIITSAGLSSGIDAALHLVSLYLGKARTKLIANELEYDWNDLHPFVRGKSADRFLPDILNVLTPFDYQLKKYEGGEQNWLAELQVKTNLKEKDFYRLLAVQTENVTGVKQKRKSNVWQSVHDGKNWTTTIKITPGGHDEYLVTMVVTVR